MRKSTKFGHLSQYLKVRELAMNRATKYLLHRIDLIVVLDCVWIITGPVTNTDNHRFLDLKRHNVSNLKCKGVIDSILTKTQTKEYSLLLIQEQYGTKLTNSSPLHQSWTHIERA